MQKYLYILIISFLSIFYTAQWAHANTDYVRSNQVTSWCDQRTWIGIVQIQFWWERRSDGTYSKVHHLDTRWYYVRHAGYITIYNNDRRLGWQWDIPIWTHYFAWCSRPDICTAGAPLSWPTQYNPVIATQQRPGWCTRHADGSIAKCYRPDTAPDYRYTNGGANWYNYWPSSSGPASQADDYWLTWWTTQRHQGSDGGWAIARYSTTTITLIPGVYGGIPDVPVCKVASCDTSVANTTLRTTTLEAAWARCRDGSPANFSSTTDAEGKTTYTWTCQKAGWTPVSCNAYYKELEDPTVNNGACKERYSVNDPRNPLRHPPRLPDQCRYSVILNQPRISMTGGVMSTQTGPTVVALTWGYLRSTNGITWNCQPPLNGRPRIVCDADSFTQITGTLSGFTLPSTVTQRVGSCQVIFDAPDVCAPKTDTITTRAVTPECDPRITDVNNTRYCRTRVTNDNVCVEIKDAFWNSILGYSTGRIVSRFSGATLVNRYFEKYNAGPDTTQYNEWRYTEVSGNYCTPNICTVVNGVLCGRGCPGEGTPTCGVTDPPPPECNPDITDPDDDDFCPCSEDDPRPECTICVNTIEEPTKCEDDTTSTENPDPTCIPTELNNFCGAPIPTTVPGCDSPDYAGDPLLCIERLKACTWHLEVADEQGRWSDNGDNIMYDQPMTYRIVVDGTDNVCRTGYVSVSSVTATGGIFSGSIAWSSTGTFTATVVRDNNTTPRSARWPVVVATYTQPSSIPGGVVYGLTARADDFEDTPLTITGERMKWVRIIGAAGSNITSFNLNNAGVIGEDSSASTVEMRNAILRNVGLLTRGITYTDLNNARVVNNVFYVEWDHTYSDLIAAMGWSSFRTIIVRWNLTIDSAFPGHETSDPIIGIITVRRADGSGGNIIVNDDVASMRGILFAEGSFYGQSQSAASNTLGNVSQNKLVLKWSLFSRNTIGGSADPENLYVSGGATTTDIVLAFMQDLNNVRNWYGCPAWGPECYKNYPDPFIIDYENTLGDPPPGFTL